MPRKAKPVHEDQKAKKRKILTAGWKMIKDPTTRWDVVSQYGYWNREGDFFPHTNYTHSCHAGLSMMKDAEVLFSYTPRPAGNVRVDDPRFIAYIKWLIKSSPWAMNKVVSPRTSVETAANHGWLITNTGLPANLIANFLVATRQPHEAWHLVERWNEFCEQGVPPNMAFVFAEALGAGQWWKNSENNHEPLDIHVISTVAVENFVNGKIASPLQPFKMSGNYRPCAALWEPNTYVSYEQPPEVMYKNFLNDKYPKKLAEGKQQSRRMFLPTEKIPELPDGNDGMGWRYATIFRSKKQWTEIALAESKRIVNG